MKELNDEIFMTYNHRYTHKLNILNKDEPTELLKATETEYPVQLHRCVNQVLVISNQIFCFQGKVSKFLNLRSILKLYFLII